MDGISRNSISDFYLDSRTPGGGGGSSSTLDLSDHYREEEAQRERDTKRQVEELLKEVRIWRIANSAQWVAWGIVQAKVPDLDALTSSKFTVLNGETITEEPVTINGTGEGHPKEATDKRPEGLKAEALLAGESLKEAEALEDEEDQFDYLAYAQDRAMFFWGDVVGLGLVKKEELPEDVRGRLKIVGY
jgi:choline kinase